MPNVIIFADKLKQTMSSSFKTNDTQFTLILRLEFTRKHVGGCWADCPPPPQPELGKRAVRILCFIFSISYILQKYWQQVCIPVGCVPPAYFPYLPACTDPGGGCLPRHPPPPVDRILDTRF